MPPKDRRVAYQPPGTGAHIDFALQWTEPSETIFKYDPGMKWYYYSGDEGNEAHHFTLFDSERKEGWRVPGVQRLYLGLGKMLIRRREY